MTNIIHTDLDLGGMAPTVDDEDPLADLIEQLSTAPDSCMWCDNVKKLSWWGNSSITHCRVCHRTWSRTSREGHCMVCHRHFGGQTGFDAHLSGTKTTIHHDPTVKEGRPPYTQDENGIWRAAPPPQAASRAVGQRESHGSTAGIGGYDPPCSTTPPAHGFTDEGQ